MAEHSQNNESRVLSRPPIVEVACGVVFDSVSELDALGLGVYWDRRAGEYPEKALQPAISESLTFNFGGAPMRAFLVNKDDQFVLQLQHDRFFMNWRKRGADYPRFSERHGKEGLLKRTLTEFALFRAFVQERFKRDLLVRRVDLNKIDFFTRGVHWNSLDDLAALLPITGTLKDILENSTRREFNLTFVERGPLGDANVNIATAVDASGPTAVRVDTRITCPCDNSSVGATFVGANDVLNRAFFRLVSSTELHRFGAVEGK